MRTLATPSPTAPGTGALRAVRDVLDHIHDDPAPLWAPGSRARLIGWVAGSMAAWTVVGVVGSALVGALVRALVGLAG